MMITSIELVHLSCVKILVISRRSACMYVGYHGNHLSGFCME